MAVKMNEREFHDKKAKGLSMELPINIFISMVLDKELKYILPELYKEKTILDVGCGDGRFSRYFIAHGAKMAVGMDISMDYMVTRSKEKDILVYNKKIKIENGKNIFFIHSDVKNIPLKNGSIDTIIAFAILHHIVEKSNFVAECNRILTDRGNLIIVDPNGGHFFRNLMNRIGRKVSFLTETENAIDIEQLSRILTYCKFSIQKVKFGSFFGDIAAHLSSVIFRKNYIFGRMVQFFVPFCLTIDLFLDATLFRVFPFLAWRYFVLAEKEQ